MADIRSKPLSYCRQMNSRKLCRELSKELRINVLGYDYSGYGRSTGTPSVSNTIADINTCYQFLLRVKGKKPQDIVVYGQSVGSGPTCDLGASEKDLKGIVLHSPLMSGMYVSHMHDLQHSSALDLVYDVLRHLLFCCLV